MSETIEQASARDGGQPEVQVLEPSIPAAGDAQPDFPGIGLGGLVALSEKGEQPLPLIEVKVRAGLAGPVCQMVVEQRFANTLDQPMEAVHIFPLPYRGAVTAMTLRAGETVVQAECREREAAERAFERAREAGHRAGLLSQESADVHCLRVTNLPPKSEVSVRIVVIQELKRVDGFWEWRFPTVIAPRYDAHMPAPPRSARDGDRPDSQAMPDGARLQPPLRLEGGTRLDMEVEIAGPVRRVAVAQHAVALELPAVDGGGLRVTPAARATLDRDFVLRFETAEPDRPALRAWTDGQYTLALLDPPAQARPSVLPRDVVFVLDRSGSMAGQKMQSARLALSTALHGLEAGDRFMLLAFDDRLEPFGEGFQDYDQASLDAADAWLARIDARGGTNMLPAIQAALAGETAAGRLRTVLFITDGQVWNEDELLAAVTHRRRSARFFSMGIDSAVNGALLERLARAGGGSCELLTPQDDIEAAVARFEARFGSPLVDGLTVTGGMRAEAGPLTLFTGQPAITLLDGAPETLWMQGVGPEAAFEASAPALRVDWPLGAIWGRRRIAALEDRIATHPQEAEGLRPEILRIALAHALLSRYTAFVAVDESVTAEGERIERVQPVELPHAWDEGFRAPPGMSVPQVMDSMPDSRRRARRYSKPGPESYRIHSMMIDIDAEMAPGQESELEAWDPGGDSLTQGLFNGVLPGPARQPKDETARRQRLAATLARSQRADGSFGRAGGGPDEPADAPLLQTALVLILLVLAGNTRRSGLRQRALAKAATWLEGYRSDPRVVLAFALLDAAEQGASAEDLAAQLAAGAPAAGLPDAMLESLGVSPPRNPADGRSARPRRSR